MEKNSSQHTDFTVSYMEKGLKICKIFSKFVES